MKAYDKRQIRRILTLEWGLGSRSRSLKTINWEHNKLFQDPRRHYKNMAWCKPCWSNRKTPLTRWKKLLQNIISDLLNDTFYNKTYCLEDVNGQNPVQKTTLKCTTSMFTVNVRPCADRVYVTHMARIGLSFGGLAHNPILVALDSVEILPFARPPIIISQTFESWLRHWLAIQPQHSYPH